MPASDLAKSKRIVAVGQATAAIEASCETRRSLMPSIGVLLVAILAMVTVQMFRIGHSRSLAVLIAEVLVFATLPCVAYVILRHKFETNSGWLLTKASVAGFQSGAILVGLLVVIWHFAIRPFGYGDANEIVALVTIQSVGWYLAVFSKVPGFEKASSILSGALVFFVCCMADDWGVFLVAGLFAFVGLWWLLGQYWSRLETKAIDGDSRSLKLHGYAVSFTMLFVVLVACLAAMIPFTQAGSSLMGFMPFSGGEKGSQSEFAISGIGDGNMLTAGKNATTTGAVESDEFIEDNKPSLYDIMSERYDGPIVKNPRNRTIPLDQIAKHLHEAKQSEQAGKTFRTMRDSGETRDLELEDRITNALFYVEGSVPARFAINNFFEFDGWDWSSEANEAESPSQTRFTLSQQNGVPVFRFIRSFASYLTGRRTHRVKIMRLDSKAIPSPALLQQWHIPLVDRLEMFQWGDSKLIEINGESIPTHTIIDLQSLVPNYHLLRNYPSSRQIKLSDGTDRPSEEANTSSLLQVPDNKSKTTLQSLANEWTSGVEPGWRQVESIVNHLRNDFELNPKWDTDETAENSVSLFLNQGGGPSYMFATACAMILRSAGYETRIANGFLIQKQDYDSQSKQSIVTAGNLHMWPEVSLDGKFWIPVEPTPGYPIPYSTQTAWQWVTAKALMCWKWLLGNPVTVALVGAFLFLAIYFRAEWITSLVFAWWFLVRLFWPQGLLKATRQLIDLRFWFAGDRRPASQTIDAWYTRVESNTMGAFFKLWNARNYSENAAPAPKRELVLACSNSVNSLTLKRIKKTCDNNAINNPSQ